MAEGLRDRRRSETRQELSRAAIARFIDKGFEHTTIDEIIEPLDIARRTFFRHFATKEDLVFVWYEDLTDELVAACAARPADEPAFASVQAALEGLLHYYDDDPAWARAMLKLASATPSLIGKSFEKRQLWERALADVIAPKLPARHRELVARVVTATAINAFVGGVDASFADPGNSDLHATVAAAFDCAARAGEIGAPSR